MPKTNDLAVALLLAVTQERIFASQLAVRQSDELLRHIAKLMVGTGARVVQRPEPLVQIL